LLLKYRKGLNVDPSMEKEKEKKDKSKTYIPSSLTSPIL
jgi:hypothetical protein